MSFVEDHTEKLLIHVDELEAMGDISEEEAVRYRNRIHALEGDLQDEYEE